MDSYVRVGTAWAWGLAWVAGAVLLASCGVPEPPRSASTDVAAREADEPGGDYPDGCATAKPVTLPFADDLNIDPAGDHDWFTFELSGPDDVVVRLETLSPTPLPFDDDTNITLFTGSDCDELAFVAFSEDKPDDFTSVVEAGAHPGTYFVDIGGWNDVSLASVDLEIEVVRPANPPPPTCDAATAATACSGGPCDCVCSGDDCACPPTYADAEEYAARIADPDDLGARWCASIATLQAVQVAIDDAAPGTTIELQAGLFDWSGVVYADDDFPLENEYFAFNMDTPVCQADGVCFGTHRLQQKYGLHQAAHGVVVLGKDDLTIRGKRRRGQWKTVLMGNPHPLAAKQDCCFLPAWYNLGFTAGGGTGSLKVADLHFDSFWMSFQGLSEFMHPADGGGNVTDPAYAGGTTRTRVKRNLFTPTQHAVLLAGAHHRPRIERNTFDMGDADGLAIGGLWGAKNVDGTTDDPERIVDARVRDNTIVFAEGNTAGGGIAAVWGYGSGRITGNTVVNGDAGLLFIGSSGWSASDNVVDGAVVGARFAQAPAFHIDQDGAHFAPHVAVGNDLHDNELRNNVVGIEVGGALYNTIEHNEVIGANVGLASYDAVWFDLQPAQGETTRVHPTMGNYVGDNELDASDIAVVLTGYTRDNVFDDNEIEGAGLFVLGDAGPRQPSGNLIVGDLDDIDLEDHTQCVAYGDDDCDDEGPTGTCPGDEDGDGTDDEDPVDGIDNDADGWTDEDALGVTNLFVDD